MSPIAASAIEALKKEIRAATEPPWVNNVIMIVKAAAQGDQRASRWLQTKGGPWLIATAAYLEEREKASNP
jgi:hypothetical protein